MPSNLMTSLSIGNLLKGLSADFLSVEIFVSGLNSATTANLKTSLQHTRKFSILELA